MANLRVVDGSTAAPPRAARVALDAAEWLAVAAALSADAPQAALPEDFLAPAFGLDGLRPGEVRAGYELLRARGLVTRRAPAPGLVALEPAFAAALGPLLAPRLRIEVNSWWQGTAINQSVSWHAPDLVALSRRRATTGSPGSAGAGGLVQEPAVHLEIAADTSPLQPVMTALPPQHTTGATGEPVTLDTRTYAALAQAVREGRLDVAEHAAGLAGEPLASLGALSHGVPGGAYIRVYGPGGAATVRHYSSMWLWTSREVLEVRDAGERTTTVQPTSGAGLHATLLGVLTSLLTQEA